MSKSRKKSDCGCGSSYPIVADPCDCSRSRHHSRGRKCFFPNSIKDLLILLAEDDCNDNRVDIILDACEGHCCLKDARVVAVMDNTVVVRDDCEFKFICIGCICEVVVDCDDLLEQLFDQRSCGR